MTLRELCTAELRAKGRDDAHIEGVLTLMTRMSQRMRDRMDMEMDAEAQESFRTTFAFVQHIPVPVAKKFVDDHIQKERKNQ